LQRPIATIAAINKILTNHSSGKLGVFLIVQKFVYAKKLQKFKYYFALINASSSNCFKYSWNFHFFVGVVVRAFDSQSGDLDSILSSRHAKRLQCLVIKASCLKFSIKRDDMKIKRQVHLCL